MLLNALTLEKKITSVSERWSHGCSWLCLNLLCYQHCDTDIKTQQLKIRTIWPAFRNRCGDRRDEPQGENRAVLQWCQKDLLWWVGSCRASRHFVVLQTWLVKNLKQLFKALHYEIIQIKFSGWEVEARSSFLAFISSPEKKNKHFSGTD